MSKRVIVNHGVSKRFVSACRKYIKDNGISLDDGENGKVCVMETDFGRVMICVIPGASFEITYVESDDMSYYQYTTLYKEVV